ncbi:MAG: hypothetical protein JO356_07285, partial [Acidobacteria bacterium]|nr:hypothetical protein [Acidobacteriota bacterium]
VRRQLEKLHLEQPSLRDSLDNLNRKLSGALEPSMQATAGTKQPTLEGENGDALNLYKEIARSDAPLTTAQSEAARGLAHRLEAALAIWKDFKAKDLAALNRQLTSAGQPPIEAKPEAEENASGTSEE